MKLLPSSFDLSCQGEAVLVYFLPINVGHLLVVVRKIYVNQSVAQVAAFESAAPMMTSSIPGRLIFFFFVCTLRLRARRGPIAASLYCAEASCGHILAPLGSDPSGMKRQERRSAEYSGNHSVDSKKSFVFLVSNCGIALDGLEKIPGHVTINRKSDRSRRGLLHVVIRLVANQCGRNLWKFRSCGSRLVSDVGYCRPFVLFSGPIRGLNMALKKGLPREHEPVSRYRFPQGRFADETSLRSRDEENPSPKSYLGHYRPSFFLVRKAGIVVKATYCDRRWRSQLAAKVTEPRPRSKPRICCAK
ncbi:unnamed protein product [Trichogramma brassicae]|uniref:Uncharacterized protein n=1 Tax=Trichogramma brassicae TaxID=86971 RepID=A0A6H5IL56_9HYME|nr:unnamed protein product [Trichogramma brassicae]